MFCAIHTNTMTNCISGGSMKISEYIEYSAEVRQALGDGRPVVAIETAGTFEAFAYPENKALANLVMDRIRK